MAKDNERTRLTWTIRLDHLHPARYPANTALPAPNSRPGAHAAGPWEQRGIASGAVLAAIGPLGIGLKVFFTGAGGSGSVSPAAAGW
jgi:hypothetical protein